MAEGLKKGDEIVPVYHSNFGLQVYVENVDKNVSEEDVWRQMEIEPDGSVIHKRLTRDPMCDSTLRATIIYNDNSYVSKVAKEIDGIKIGAHIIRADMASNKVELLKSSEIASAARDGEFTGEVFVSGFSSRFQEKHLRWMFEKFGFKSVTVMRNCNGESTGAAMVKLSCWNFAMRAEIAFDGIAVEGGSKLYVIARRNRQQKVCLPWKLVEVMMENNPVKERSTTSRSLELKLAPTVTEQQSTAATLASGTVLFELGVQLGTDKIEGEIDSERKESKLSETDGAERGTEENQSGLEAEKGGQKDNAEISVCDVKKKSCEIENNVKASYGGEKASLSESNGKEQTDIDNGSQGSTAVEPTPAQKLEQIGHSMRKLSAKKHRHVYFGAIGKEDEAEIPEERDLEQSPVSSTESTDRSSGLGLQFHMEMDDIEERSTCRCRDVCQCTCNCEGACQCHCQCKDYCRCRNRR